MKLCDFISSKAIVPLLKATDKISAIEELVLALKKGSKGEKFSVADTVEAIVKREKMGSTGIGGGVGIPHAKLPGVKGVIGAFGRTSVPIEFNAVDGEPVRLIFVILAPEAQAESYLKALKKIMAALKQPNFLKFLRGAKTVKDIELNFREVEEVPV